MAPRIADKFRTGHVYDNAGELQYVVDEKWISVINSRYIMGVDGMSLPLIALTLLIVPLCIIYSLNHFPEPHNPKAFLALLLILETGMVGTFVAQDLILFFVYFEIVLLPLFFMIAVWGGEDRQYAAIKFFLFTLMGSALMILSFLALFFQFFTLLLQKVLHIRPGQVFAGVQWCLKHRYRLFRCTTAGPVAIGKIIQVFTMQGSKVGVVKIRLGNCQWPHCFNLGATRIKLKTHHALWSVAVLYDEKTVVS